eukprot:2976359-Pleurochrysis_carterae.AAC.1
MWRILAKTSITGGGQIMRNGSQSTERAFFYDTQAFMSSQHKPFVRHDDKHDESPPDCPRGLMKHPLLLLDLRARLRAPAMHSRTATQPNML